MALIGKNNIRNADVPWPNPFGLKASDAIGMLKGYPLEAITLAMIESILHDKTGAKDILRELQKDGLAGTFLWSLSKDGNVFWKDIIHKELDIFYKTYTPDLLKERIEEVRPLIRYYKPRKK